MISQYLTGDKYSRDPSKELIGIIWHEYGLNSTTLNWRGSPLGFLERFVSAYIIDQDYDIPMTYVRVFLGAALCDCDCGSCEL